MVVDVNKGRSSLVKSERSVVYQSPLFMRSHKTELDPILP